MIIQSHKFKLEQISKIIQNIGNIEIFDSRSKKFEKTLMLDGCFSQVLVIHGTAIGRTAPSGSL